MPDGAASERWPGKWLLGSYQDPRVNLITASEFAIHTMFTSPWLSVPGRPREVTAG